MSVAATGAGRRGCSTLRQMRGLARVAWIVVAVVAVVATLAGCGGSTKSATPKSTQTPSTTSTSVPTTTTSESTTTTTTTTVPKPAGVSQEVTTSDGWRYRITLAPGGRDLQGSPIPGGCVGIPPPGKTDLDFIVTITNLATDRPAPSPEFTTGVNLTQDGLGVQPQATNVEGSQFSGIEVAGSEQAQCPLQAGLGSGALTIEPGKSTVPMHGIVGPMVDPPPSGLKLFLRVFDHSGPGIRRVDIVAKWPL